MSASEFMSYLRASMGTYLPSVLGAVAILLVGIIVALVVRAGIRKALNAVKLNERISENSPSPINATGIAASLGFWFVVILTFIGVFSILQFDDLSGPLSALLSTVMLYLPRIVLAGILALVAWLVATAVRAVVNRTMSSTKWDEKLSKSADVQPLSSVLGNVLYWLTLLLFLPAIVGALSISGLMGPLTGMTDELLAALPNIFSAIVIGVVGWLIARVLRGLATNLLAASGVDKMNDRAGLTEGVRLSELGGTLAFILVIVPTLIAALQALQISAISDPATEMLSLFLIAVPNILAAALILIVAWFVGRFISGLLTTLLQNLGFDNIPAKLGFSHSLASTSAVPSKAGKTEPATVIAASRQTLSELAGHVALFFIMLFATVEAAHRVGFTGVKSLLQTFISFGADILLGLVIFVIGYWLANIAADAIQRANRSNAVGLSRIARLAILGLVIAMGLRAMGIADAIVNLAFGLVLGAVAVACALAFGLGGREAANSITKRWAGDYLEKKKSDSGS